MEAIEVDEAAVHELVVAEVMMVKMDGGVVLEEAIVGRENVVAWRRGGGYRHQESGGRPAIVGHALSSD